jgi:hypothetical protein
MNIATERLGLREFVAEDWPAVLAYQRDPSYLRFYPSTNRTEPVEGWRRSKYSSNYHPDP